MRKLLTTLCTVALLFACSMAANGQDFVYTPKNPAFGGNVLNYSWLLNSANAQNTIEEPAEAGENLLGDFENSFNQQFLSQLTRELLNTNDIFGEDGIQTGTFEVGNLILDIVPGLNGLVITINDIVTGGQTQITIPYD